MGSHRSPQTGSESPITAKDISEYLRSARDDFAHELRVLNVCKEIGFEIRHGGAYEDPATKKTRQFDIRTSIRRHACKIQLAVECKNLKPTYPLVISCVPRTKSECYNELVFCCGETMPGLRGETAIVSAGNQVRSLAMTGLDSLYEVGQPVGKSCTQVGRADNGGFKSGDSDVFDKWSQALASSQDLLSAACSYNETYNTRWFLSATQPILVVPDEVLWVVNYTADGLKVAVPQLANECFLYVGKEYKVAYKSGFIQYAVSHLPIMTLRRFRAYLEDLKDSDSIWSRLFDLERIQRKLNLRLDLPA